MLSPQSTKVASLTTNPPRQKFGFLLKTCSSSAIKSIDTLHQVQHQSSQLEQNNYSKLLKQKDIKILKLLEKVRVLEGQLAHYENSHSTLQNDLQFFKGKIEEEFYRNMSLQGEIEAMNNTVKGFISKIINTHPYAKLQLQANAEQTHLDSCKRLLTSLEAHIPHIFHLNNPKDKSSQKRKDATLSPRMAGTMMKGKALRLDSYRESVQTNRAEMEYIANLDNHEPVNDLYEVALAQYNIDFYQMTKPQVVKLCIELLGKLKQLEHDRAFLINKLKGGQMLQKEKYMNMLRSAKPTDSKVSIKKISTMNYLQ